MTDLPRVREHKDRSLGRSLGRSLRRKDLVVMFVLVLVVSYYASFTEVTRYAADSETSCLEQGEALKKQVLSGAPTAKVTFRCGPKEAMADLIATPPEKAFAEMTANDKVHYPFHAIGWDVAPFPSAGRDCRDTDDCLATTQRNEAPPNLR